MPLAVKRCWECGDLMEQAVKDTLWVRIEVIDFSDGTTTWVRNYVCPKCKVVAVQRLGELTRPRWRAEVGR